MLEVNKGAKALKLLAPPGAQGDIIGYMEAYMAEMIMLGSQETILVSMMYYDEASNTVAVFVWDHFRRYPYIIDYRASQWKGEVHRQSEPCPTGACLGHDLKINVSLRQSWGFEQVTLQSISWTLFFLLVL